MKKIKSIETFVAILTFLLFACGLAATASATEKKEVAEISINAKDVPLVDVLKEVYKQTGYTVDIKKEWEDLSIRGNYEDVDIEHFLTRVFKGKNVSIISDIDNKTYYVRLFGEKVIAKSGGGASLGQSRSQNPVIIDINDLHEAQRKELQEYMASPEAKDPSSGVKLSEIRGIHEDNRNEVAELRNSQENRNLNSLHQQQKKEIANTVGTKTAKDPTSDKTVAEIETIRQNQSQELDTLRNNPQTTVDPLTGLTLSEIEAMHEKQRQEFQDLKKNAPVPE